MASVDSRISERISHTGTGVRNKGGNFIGQLCISVVPPFCEYTMEPLNLLS